MTNDLQGIPCVLMRGGTSKGPFFLGSDLPQDAAARNDMLLSIMGSGHPLQINGIGGGHPLTSKVAIVSPSTRPGADVDYQFIQVQVLDKAVDLTPNCGNMLAAVGPFAIEAGLVAATGDNTCIHIFNINTGKYIDAWVPTANGGVRYEGDAGIGGVPGTAAPIVLTFVDAAGGVTGSLLPTGNAIDEIDGIPVTCLDCAIPMVLIHAEDLGLTGGESPADLDENRELIERLQRIRILAAARMKIDHAEEKVVPKPVILSRSTDGWTIRARYFMPWQCHLAIATTGAVGIATACATEGTIAWRIADPVSIPARVTVEHPSGRFEVALSYDDKGDLMAGVLRTARRLFEGRVFLQPRSAAPGQGEDYDLIRKNAVQLAESEVEL